MAFAQRYALQDHETACGLSWWRANDLKRAEPGIEKPDHADHERYKSAIEADAADREELEAFQGGTWLDAVKAHLLELRASGRLGSIANAKGRKIWFADAWNAFVAGGEIDAERWMTSKFNQVLTWSLVSLRRKDGGTKASWEALCAAMDEGTSDLFDTMRNIEVEDGSTGERCQIVFAKWKPTLMRHDKAWNLEPVGPRKKRPLTQVELEFASGDILLTDYLRAGTPTAGKDGGRDETPFSRAVDLGDEEYGTTYSLSSEDGRAERTIIHAKRHKMGYAQTTNTSVVVHRHPDTGALLISQRYGSERDEDAEGDAMCPGWDKVGTFSCDMWRITCLDVSAAQDLMREGGDEAPKATLDAYLSSHDCYARNVVRTSVEPGRWRLHAGENFSARVNRKRHAIPKGIRPWMLIEKI